jgi:FixJ family two-component response regulator
VAHLTLFSDAQGPVKQVNPFPDVTKPRDTIAVVDDDASVRRALARLLSVFGFRVVQFGSADDFLHAAPTCGASFAVVDVELGDCSGFDLARQLDSLGIRLPIVFITGSDGDDFRSRALGMGCAYLRKPLPEGRLIEALERLAGRQLSR